MANLDRDMPGTGPCDFLLPAMTKRQKRLFVIALIGWFVTIGYFWTWWLRPEHIDGVGRFVFSSAILAWLTLMPLYFLLNVLRATRPNPNLQIAGSSRVAMVVTKAPSEPFPVVRKTLEAMLAQDYPHDTWIADEDPSPETIAWCEDHGVYVSTRKGRADYHRAVWPRRTRCKEGNLAFFYDQFGYGTYDYVAQLDADHIPTPSYLRHLLAPFADPSVGYVSAPSICDGNASESWAARGRMYPEGMFHGALQVGHSTGGASLCIGSHYAVRTVALKEAGGIGPELAEDHSTSLLIAAAGWKGRHAIDAIAHGDGPQTFADMVTQEFQWSRSLMTILLEYSPKYVPQLPPRLQFQFLFCQFWYPLFAVFSLLMFVMPLYALATDSLYANINFPQFILYYAPNSIMLILIVCMLKWFGLARPYYAKSLSWEGTLFLFFARWPWVIWGTISAVRDHVTKSFVDFRVTPKGNGPKSLLPLRVSAPYMMLAAVSALAVFASSDVQHAVGFYWFAAFNAFLYGVLVLVILIKHLRENKIPLRMNLGRVAVQGALGLATIVGPVAAFRGHGLEGIYGLQFGAEPLRLVRVSYPASGAGRGGEGERVYTFDPAWITPAGDFEEDSDGQEI